MPSINVNISSGADDGNASTAAGALVTRHYTQTAFGVASNFTGGVRHGALGALRFQTINIPQGATINSATLSIVKKGVGITAPNAKIYGNNVNNAGAWGTSNLVLNIAKTAHSTSLDTTNATSSNNVTAIVQDIVNRAGWVANNAMAFGIFPNNTIGIGGTAYWTGFAFEKGAPNIPNLSVTYTTVATRVFDFMGFF